MALADAVASALRPAQEITWTRADGTTENLTGATLSGVIKSNTTGVVRAIAGSLALTDAANGVFTWTYVAADVVAGSYVVQFTATFGAGLTPAKTFDSEWTVHIAHTV